MLAVIGNIILWRVLHKALLIEWENIILSSAIKVTKLFHYKVSHFLFTNVNKCILALIGILGLFLLDLILWSRFLYFFAVWMLLLTDNWRLAFAQRIIIPSYRIRPTAFICSFTIWNLSFTIAKCFELLSRHFHTAMAFNRIKVDLSH